MFTSSKKFLDIQATIECGLTRTYSQMHGTDKHSEHSSIIWPVWVNGWVFVFELSGSWFASSCSHLNFWLHACYEQELPWHLGNYRVWIHSETRTWHDKNTQSNSIWFKKYKWNHKSSMRNRKTCCFLICK